MDYLWMHTPLIRNESYHEGDFSIPATVEEVDELLPGNTQYEDIDDLLVTIGKQTDRILLHSFVSKLLKVPQRLLVEAERDHRYSVQKSVLEAVHQNRRRAKDAAAAIASGSGSETEDESDEKSWPKPIESIEKVQNIIFNDAPPEYADPEHICDVCLPIYGDEFVGTRPEGNEDATPTVHRMGCPHAQRAINRALTESQRSKSGKSLFGFKDRIDSVTLRRSVRNPSLLNQAPVDIETPVNLQWAEFPGPGEGELSLPCEVVVHAEDRKLLLADCSEVVSELSEILKTGSQTTNEHATLVFLISVRGIEELQKLMDSLQQIRSVMSVERRVSGTADKATSCLVFCVYLICDDNSP
jgi:(p)ppGpp synthase/HD superfamily hydrolase